MTKYTERNGYNGELAIAGETRGCLLEIDVTEDGQSANFLVQEFDRPMIALDVLGHGVNDHLLPIPPASSSDDALLNIARGALMALKNRRAEAARQEADRKKELEQFKARLDAKPLNLAASLPEQLHALGFRLATGGDA